MGLPAARTPDLTSHIALTGVIAAAIDASNMPGPAMVAAYIGAMLLQIPTGAIIPPCMPTVIIGFLPAARVLDLHACVPHLSSNTIIKGSETVVIGMLPAARLTSKCFCAAEVTTGWPTVLIGGPTVTIPVNIKGDADFVAKTQKMMGELYATPTGKKMFKGIADSGNTVTVVPTSDANGYCQAENGPNSHDPTKGSNSTVSWNPAHTGDPPSTSTIIGGHEFVHAYHNATGTAKDGPYDSYPGQTGSSDRGEERATVGTGGTSIVAPDGTTQTVPDHSHDSPTENSLRDDLGVARRPTYYPSNWPGGPPW